MDDFLTFLYKYITHACVALPYHCRRLLLKDIPSPTFLRWRRGSKSFLLCLTMVFPCSVLLSALQVNVAMHVYQFIMQNIKYLCKGVINAMATDKIY